MSRRSLITKSEYQRQIEEWEAQEFRNRLTILVFGLFILGCAIYYTVAR
jgi:hypothetical protein